MQVCRMTWYYGSPANLLKGRKTLLLLLPLFAVCCESNRSVHEM